MSLVHVLPYNSGFAGGYNLSLKNRKADFFVLLNSDAEPAPNWLEPILEIANNNPNFGACQPKILDYFNHTKFEYAGAAAGYIDIFGYPFCKGRIFGNVETDNGQYNESGQIFWASGAAMFIKREAWEKANGLDEAFFAHMEEIDLCWRLKNIGYSVYVEPKSKIYHIGGGTLNKISTKKTFLNFRNNLITITKNDFSKNIILKLVFRLILDGIAALKFLLAAQPSHFIAVIRAHFAYYYRLPSTISKRKINNHKKISCI